MTPVGDVPGTPYGRLLPQHLKLITDSSISPEVSKARGYRSVTTRAELARLGFPPAQQLVPGLLIPICNVAGDVATYQLRPDVRRIRDSKPVKYETMAGTRMVIDVPPMARRWLAQPKHPLFITEGARKADAAVSRELCCIDLLGVWNWRGRNKHGGKGALPDWESIPVNDRQVYIAFDSDAVQKRGVYAALARLKPFLESRGARVRIVYLPTGPDGAKVGLDDYLAKAPPMGLLRHFSELAVDELRPASENTDDTHVAYEAAPDGLAWLKPTKDGPVPTPLTNFTAEILTDVVEDDGVEVHHLFQIEAHLGDELRRFVLSARQFNAMQWPIEHLGAHAIVFPGFGLADHARAAIQFLSQNTKVTRIYTHTGWRELDGVWGYLHAGGAIGPDGPLADVEVRLSELLTRFELPAPPAGEDRVDAIRASLRLLDAGPDRVMLPLYAAMVRAAVASADFSVHLSGTTGTGKTAIATLAEQHFGAQMDAEHLPASWSSTGNALEALGFQAKDALLVVDDFAPTGSQGDVHRLHREADRVLRAQGNRSGRQRMRPDGSLRPSKPPRGLVLSTGEDVPWGQSLRARVLILELKKPDLDWSRVTECQVDARNGLYAQALAGFIQWLAPQYMRVQADLRSEITRRRQKSAGSATHRRVPTIIANLRVALDFWLRYAEDARALTSTEVDTLWERALTALDEAARAQVQHQEASEPTRRFLELLAAAMASGRAHVAGIGGNAPGNAEAWGWRSDDESGALDKRSHGDRIGWVAGDDLYLEPEASFAVVQRLARDGGDSITVGSKTLHKRLHERGLLASVDVRRRKLTVRRQLEGQRRTVLHLKARDIAVMERPNGPNA